MKKQKDWGKMLLIWESILDNFIRWRKQKEKNKLTSTVLSMQVCLTKRWSKLSKSFTKKSKFKINYWTSSDKKV